MNATLLSDDLGRPLFAVLPYADYLRLLDNSQPEAKHAVSNNQSHHPKRFIDLPHSGGERLDVARFIAFWLANGITEMAVAARAQAYDKFDHTELNRLDPVIRRVFLRDQSPYKNTMQAVTKVVDDIVATGVFVKVKADFGYYRPVNALKILEDKAKAYLDACGNPAFVFPEDAFVRP